MLRKALLAHSLQDGKVQCQVCEHFCVLSPNEWGKCGVRVNADGELKSAVYSNAVALHVDPIEKKPLFHFYPGSEALSVGTYGCNLKCQWCQNWEISQVRNLKRDDRRSPSSASPEELVAYAVQRKIRSIAYTYNEPTVFFEYSLDTAKLAREAGIKNVYVSNGFMSQQMLDLMGPYLDAINVDLKGFTDELYRTYCGARLGPVKRNIDMIARQTDIWIEVTTLVIPDLNDGDAELTAAAEWLASVDPEMPWHISAFYPSYQMLDRPRTPVATLDRAYEIGKKAGIKHVYVGNVMNPTRERTYCPNCQHELIDRMGYRARTRWATPGICPKCGAPAAGVWK